MKQGLNFKRFFASLMLLAVSTLSWAYGFTVAGIYYDWNSDGKSVTVTYKTSSDRGYSGSVTIPATVTYGSQSYSVTSIGYNAFRDCSGLTSVTIPNSVTSIGNSAFYYCSGLTSVTCMAEEVPSMGGSVFSGVPQSTATLYVPAGSVDAYKAAAQWIEFGTVKGVILSGTCGNGVNFVLFDDYTLTISGTGGMFDYTANTLPWKDYTTEIRNVQIEDGVRSIGDYAFRGCSGLTSITIPNSVTSIGDYTFYGCSGLTSITIPEGVESIGKNAFYGCTSLPVINNVRYADTYLVEAVDKTERTYNIKEGTRFIGSYAFLRCSRLTSINIPNSVTSIGDDAFNDCSGLTSITIPNSVTSIGGGAFFRCSGLASITIPNSVTSIGSSAFSNCSGLTSITIPNSVTSIGSNAFYGCSGLTSITIPNSVTSIGEGAFEDCSALTSVTINSNALLSKYYAPYNNIKNIFGSQIEKYIIGGGVTSIGDYAFYNCSGLTSVTIPSSVTSIGNYAFYNCSKLTSITIPNSVTRIGNYAFDGCSGLNFVTIGSGVTSIGQNAFYNCSGFSDIIIPESVTSIGESAFKGCSGLKFVTLNSNTLVSKTYTTDSNLGTIFGSQVTYYKIGNNVTSIGQNAFYNCSGLSDFIIPESVTSIGDYAFYNCSGLTSITIPERVTNIGNYTFYNCSGLTSINIPNSVTSIDEWAFYNCSGLTSVTIGGGVTSIGGNAFSGCSSLTSITIPYSVTSIGQNAFYYCSHLTDVTIGMNVTSIGKDAFRYCFRLTKAKFASIESLCNIAFHDNVYGNPLSVAHHLYVGGQEVKDLVIPNNVTNIRFGTFYGCSGLTSVTIPNSVTSIGQSAFADCSGLNSVTVGGSVTNIGKYAFSGCSGLTSVTCLAEKVPSMGGSVFSGVPQSSATLNVPAVSVYAYKATEQWKEFGKILPIDGDDHVYIETDFTSLFPTDYLGWNGATGYTSTTFAPMVTTNDGRTVQVCEKFNGSVAAEGVVFNRTLSGLTNGTYRIELYGAAASTKGRDAGIDSDMTQADEGDETAVYLYATTTSGTVKQYIPVHWATSFSEVATAVLNNVVVTDGTVEIGMYSEKKFTNWEVVQIKGVTALVDVVELHANTLMKALSVLDDAAYVNVTGEERTALSQAIADNTTVTEQTASAYQAAIAALEDATKTFTDAKESYDTWADVAKRSYPYASAEKKSAAESAASVLPTSARDALSKAESLKPLFRRYAESSALMEGIEGAVDVTATYIRNPKAEEAIDANVWQTVLGEGSGGSVGILGNEPWTDSSGSTSHKYFDGGNWRASAWDVTFKQDITLPAGRYQLTAVGRSSQDVALTLIGGEATAEMAHINATGGLFNNGWEQTSLEFELTEETTVSIGARGATNVIHNWMSFSDFRLVRFPGCILSGKCGANVDFVLTSDYTLTISGTGDMFDYNANTLPWKNYTAEIKNVVVEDGVTNIGQAAFVNCSELSFVTIPESVTRFGAYAFSGCSSLTSITIPDGVTSIGEGAFRNCSGLTSITIPESVTSIGVQAFGYCSGLTSISIDVNNSVYDSRKNCNAIIETATNTLVSGCKNTTIPVSVTSIGDYAFEYCSGLTSITIPDGVTSIGDYAFEYCSGLTSITIPDGVTSIGDYAFEYCSGLTSITIPNSVTSIGAAAFGGCSGLKSVTIGSGVKSIGGSAFSGCSGLTSIYVDSNNSVYDNRNNCNAIIETASNMLISGCKNTIIPNSVTSISNSAFSGCSGLTSVTIGNGVTSIGYGAFWGCSGLTSVTCLAENVPTTGSSAFYNVPQSTATLYVPAGSVDAYKAAEQWKEFGTITANLPVIISFADANVKAICVANWDTNGDGELSETEAAAVTSLGEVFKDNTTITSFDELQYFTGLTTIGDYAFSGCTGLTSVTIPESVTSIGEGAFLRCSGLTSITIPSSVTSIGQNAFYGCSGLTSIDIPNSVTSIGSWAFYYCSGLTSIYVDSNNSVYDSRNNCNAIIETSSNTLISGCKNTVIPNSVTSIGQSAFADCSGLTSIIIPNSVTSISNSAFFNCSGLTSVTIPESVTSIGDGAFGGCSGLTSIAIPNSVTSISNSAFSGCSGLTSVTIGKSVTSIGDYTFWYCSGLTSITIPNSVTSIGNYAFFNCSGLTSVICLAENVPNTGSNVFYNVPKSTATLYVPAGSVDAYKAAEQWKEFGTITAYSIPPTSVALNKTETTLGVGAQEQLTATVLPEEAEQAVTWTSSDPTVATVDENGLVTAVAAGTATITATTTDGTRLTASCEVKVAIPGDVNGDGNVNGADIVAVINYVLADDIAGDVNGDGNVNGADIVAVINYVLNDSGNNARQALAQSRAAVAEEPAEILSGTKTDEGISLSLTGGEDCTAFQFMLSLPEGASLTAVTGSEERLGDHELLFRRQQDGRYLVLGYAMDNHCIGESSGELLSLRLEGNANGRATVSEALIFTPQSETRYMNALEIDLPTAVSGVRAKDAVEDGDIYDLGGRKLNKKPSGGYYIQGGKKYFVK